MKMSFKAVLVCGLLCLIFPALPAAAIVPSEHCSGDGDHHAHDYSNVSCIRQENPHYPTDVDADKDCSLRTAHCGACADCCYAQRNETEICRCDGLPGGGSACRAWASQAQQTCSNKCVGSEVCQ